MVAKSLEAHKIFKDSTSKHNPPIQMTNVVVIDNMCVCEWVCVCV